VLLRLVAVASVALALVACGGSEQGAGPKVAP